MVAVPMFKRIAGIDQSLNSTGIAIIDAETGLLVYSETISLNKNKSTPKLFGPARLIHIRNRIKELLSAHQVDFVALEGYSFGSRGASIFDLGEVGGAIRILVYDLGLPFETVPPKTLKKYIAQNGNADKEMMLKSIEEKYKITFDSSDEADAFGLALMAKEIGPVHLKEFCYPEKKKKTKKDKKKKGA